MILEMATHPSPVSLRAHHGYRSWSTDWYDEQGHRRTRRFGKEGEVTKRMARARFENWKRNEYESKAHVRNPDDPNAYTVDTLCDDYWSHALAIYRKNGKASSHIAQVKAAVQSLRGAYAGAPVQAVDAPGITRLLNSMIKSVDRQGGDRTLGISTVNGRLRVIRLMFNWGRMNTQVPAAIAYDVSLVRPLRVGRCAAKAPKLIKPVPEDVLRATLAEAPQTVADMAWVQYWTGMRPGEVCQLKPCHIEPGQDVWFYRPPTHKTEHHGIERVVPIGPQAQKILEPYIARRTFSEYVFLPEDAHRERLEQIGFEKVIAYQMSRSTFKPGRCFKHETYRNKIQYACDRAFDANGERRAKRDYSHRWHPNQLRHNMATRYREVLGLEAAQEALGHTTAGTTLIYAERSMARMREAAKVAG